MKPVRILATYVAIAAAHQLLRGADTPFVPGGAEVPPPTDANTGFLNLGLQGVGRVSASAMDAFGETFGSVSGLQISGWKLNTDGSYSGKFLTLPDRGFNSGSAYSDYKTRIQELDFTFTPNDSSSSLQSVPAQSQISIRYTGGTLLKVDGQGLTTGALPTKASPIPGSTSSTQVGTVTDSNSGVNKIAIDAEGLALLADGSGYISDEYGPNIYFFDAAKNLKSVITPPESARPRDAAGNLIFTSATDPKTGRRGNQGMESIAISPDGTRLFAMLQSATIQDSTSGSQNRNWTRLYVYDISQNPSEPPLIGEHLVNLPRLNDTKVEQTLAPNKTAAQSEIVALDNQRILMLSRDSNGNGTGNSNPSVLKSVFIVDTNGATNILPLDTTASFAAAPSAQPLADITPITPVQFVNLIETSQLAKFGLNTNTTARNSNTLSEKWEGMALVSALDPNKPNDFFLFTANDNDFLTNQLKMKAADGSTFTSASVPASDAPNDTMFMAHRVTLPQSLASQVASGIAASLPASVSALIRDSDLNLSEPDITHNIAGNTLVVSNPLVVQSDLEIGQEVAGINVGSYKLELNGAIVGTGTLSLVGTEGGSATFLDTRTMSGKTEVSTVTLEIATPESLGNTGLNLSHNAKLAPLASGTLNAPIGLYVGGGTIDAGSNQLEISGSIEGPGSLQLTGTKDAVIRLTQSQSLHTGGTTITDATVRIASGLALGPSTSSVKILNGTLQAEQNLSIDSNITIDGATGTLHSGDSILSVQGEISGQGSLHVDGYTGTVSLAGPNTHTGGTSVIGGNLALHREDALGSGPLTLAGGHLSAEASFAIERDLVITSQKSQILLGENNLELLGKVHGDAGLRVQGANDAYLKLSSGNVFSGTVEAVDTNLRISSDSALGEASNDIHLENAGLQIDSGFDTQRNLVISGKGSIQIGDGNSEFSGNITGKGDLTLTGGAGVNILLSGINDLSNVSVEGVTLQLQDRSGIGQASLRLSNATIRADGNLELEHPVTIDRSAAFDASGHSISLAGPISGEATLLLQGGSGGNVMLRGTNTFTGDIRAEGVTLAVSKDSSFGDASNQLFLQDASLTVDASAKIDRSIDISATSSIRAINSANVIVDGRVSGNGSLVLEGDVDTSITLAQPNTYEGTTSIMGTRVKIADASALGAGDLNVQSGTLAALGNLDLSRAINVVQSATFDATEFSVLLAGPIAGDADLLITGASGSSLTLSGINSFRGNITVETTDLAISADAALGHADNHIALIDAALTATASTTLDRDIVVTGKSTLRALSSSIIHAIGSISGSGHLSLEGDAESAIRLAPGNSHFGGTSIRGTRLLIDDASALGSGPIQFDGGTIEAEGNLDISTPIAVTGGGATIDAAAHSIRISSPISGAGQLLISGSASSSVILASENHFSGPITVDGGTLAVSSDHALGDSQNLVTLKSATLQFLSSIVSNRSIEIVNQATLDLLEGASQLSGPLSGHGSLDLRGSHDTSLLLTGSTDLSAIRVHSTTLDVETAANVGSADLSLHDARLRASGNLDLANPINVVSRGFIDAGEHSIQLSGGISGTGNLHLEGTPTSSIRILGQTLFAGGVSVTDTELQIESANALGAAANKLALQNATLAALESVEITHPLDLTGTSTVRALSGANVQLTGPISGDGKLVLTGDAESAFNLKNVNSFQGGTDVVSTHLVLADARSIGSGPLTLVNAELQAGAPLIIPNTISVVGNDSHLNVDGHTVSLAGPLVGLGNLTITGGPQSVLQIQNAAQFAGALTVIESQIETTSGQSLGSNLRAITLDGATLRSKTDIDLSSPIEVGERGATIHAEASTVALRAGITGKGPLQLSSSPTGSVVVAGDIRNLNETQLIRGSVSIASASALAGQRLRIGTDATLRVAVTDASIAEIAGSGKIEIVQNGNLTIAPRGTDSSFEGTIDLNLGTIIKKGLGGLTLSGRVGTQGNAAVEDGTLTLAGLVWEQGTPFKSLTLNSQTTLFINANSGTIDLSNVLSGTGRVVNVGSATINVGSFTGSAINLGLGKIISASGNTTTSTAIVASGETLSVSADITKGQINLQTGSVIQVGGKTDTTKPLEMSASLQGSGTIEISAGADVILGGDANAFTGITRVGQGAKVELKSRIGSTSTIELEQTASALWSAPSGAILDAPRLQGTGTFTVASGSVRIGENKSFTGKTELQGAGVQATITGTLYGELAVGAGATASFSPGSETTPTVLPSLTGSGTLNLAGGIITLNRSAATFDGVTKLSDKATLIASADLPKGNIENQGLIQTTPAAGSTIAIKSNISGTGALAVNGSGTVEIESGTVFTGPTAIESGTLKVSHPDGLKNSAKLTVGNAPSSSAILDVRNLGEDGLVIGQSASLGGSGTVLGKIVNQGTTAPGNSPGTLSVDSYTAAGTVEIEYQLSQPGSLIASDKINAATELVIQNTATLHFTPWSPSGISPRFKNPVSFVLASAPQITLPSNVKTFSSNPFVEVLLTKVDNNLVADLSRSSTKTYQGELYRLYQLTQNARNIAGAFNQAAQSSSNPTALDTAIDGLEQLILDANASGTSNANLAAIQRSLAQANPRPIAEAGRLALERMFALKTIAQRAPRPKNDSEWTAWSTTTASQLNITRQPGLSGWHTNLNSSYIGVEKTVGVLDIGIFGGGGQSNAQPAPGTTVRSDDWLGGITARGQIGFISVCGVAATGISDNRTKRPTDGATAHADFENRQSGLSIRSQYEGLTAVGGIKLKPTLGVDVAAYRQSAARESGNGPTNLITKSKSGSATRTSLGFDSLVTHQVASLPAETRLAAAWIHDFSPKGRAVNATLAGNLDSGTFETRGSDLSADAFECAVSHSLRISSHMSFEAGASVEARSTGITARGNVGFQISF